MAKITKKVVLPDSMYYEVVRCTVETLAQTKKFYPNIKESEWIRRDIMLKGKLVGYKLLINRDLLK